MSIRLIALDIDGTILDQPTGLKVLPAVRKAVAEAQKANITVALCTSRMAYTLQDALDKTDGISSITTFVAASGAEVIVNNKSVQRTPLPALVWQLALSLAAQYDFFIGIGTANKLLICQRGDLDPAASPEPHIRILPATALAAELTQAKTKGDEALLCYLYDVHPEQMAPFSKQFASAGAEVVPAGDTCLLLTAKAVDKGRGLLALAAQLGISAHEIMAVGNDFNDLPMFAIAGIAVAMGNAPVEVQAAAHKVVADVWHAGAAQAIYQLALGERLSEQQSSLARDSQWPRLALGEYNSGEDYRAHSI